MTAAAAEKDKDPLDDIVGITHTKPQPITKYNNNKNRKNKEKGEGQKNNNNSYNDNNDAKTESYLQKYHENEDLLAEAIIIGGNPYFAIAAPKFGNPDESSIILQESIPLNENVVLKPPEFTSYINKPYVFKSEQEFQQFIDIAKKETFDTLYHRVKSIWEKYVDADDFHLSICAADTIYTYYQDKIGLTHYLFFVGNNGSGKSNNLRLFQFLAYRNMTSTDMTAANIYQFLGSMEEGQGTICEDEADNIDGDDKDKMRIYKNGYTTGYPVLRTDTTCGRKQQRFNTFCFKAFAAERTPDSVRAKGFNQRIIELPCIYGFPRYDISEIINPAGEEEFHELLRELNETRNLLLIHRLIHYQDKIPDVKLNIENREKQLFKPLIRVFQHTETLKELLPIISKYVRQKRETNANSLHAFLYRTIRELVEAQNTTELESSLIWNTIKETLQGNGIPNKPQSYQSIEFGMLSQKEIVQILKDVFYAKKVNRHGENRKLAFDKEKLEKMGKIYDLSIDIDVKSEEGETEQQKMKAKNGTHGTHASSGGQVEVIEPEIAGTHGTHGTLVGGDKHTVSQESDDDNKKGEGEQDEKDIQVNPKEIEKHTDEQEQEQEQNNDSTSITEKVVTAAQQASKPSEPNRERDDNNTIHADNVSHVSHVSQQTHIRTKDGDTFLENNQHVSQASHEPLDNKKSDDDNTIINANSLPKTSKGSHQIMIFNNNNNTKISNLEPAVYSERPTETQQQQQNKSFNCFYCSKSHSTDKERITHIDYEHPGKIYYPTPEDFENRLNK